VVTPLPYESLARLRAAPYAYAEVGATRGVHPDGYRTFTVARRIGLDLAEAAERLLSWQVQERAGLTVRASSPRAAAGEVVEMRLRGLRVPCRVVYVVEEAHRAGFAYGTLAGHPECGEELFLLEESAGAVTFTVSAFSRPASALARLAGPIARRAQDVMTRRYLGAL
jgi:uncharacterized protein (UPF0548 family)